MRSSGAASLLLTLLAISAPAHDWNGLAIDGQGALWAVDAEDGTTWRIAPDGRTTIVVSGSEGAALHHPHHLDVDESGRLWFPGG